MNNAEDSDTSAMSLEELMPDDMVLIPFAMPEPEPPPSESNCVAIYNYLLDELEFFI